MEQMNNEQTIQMIVVNTYSDDGNRVETIKDSNGKLHQYSYNATTNLLQEYTDPNGNKTTYTYTDDKRLETVACGSSSVSYAYDAYNLISIATGGKTYTFESDDFYDSTESIKIGSLTLMEHLYAVNNGRLEKSIYGNGTYVEPIYQSETDDTVVGKSIDGTVTESYLLDATNTIGIVEDCVNDITTTYEYDELGRIKKQSDSRYSHEVTYSYDEYSRLKNRTSLVSVVNDKYADLTGVTMRRNLTTVTLNDKNQLASSGYGYGNLYYVYDSIGRLLSTYILDNMSLDVQMFPTSYTYVTRDDGYSTSQIQSYTVGERTYSYTYDNNGNILSIFQDGTVVAEYTYDGLNQLISETRDGKVYIYSYDSAGNLQSVTENGNEIKTYGYSDTNWLDKLTSFNGNSITYDNIGNPLTYHDGKAFTWQKGRQLASINVGENVCAYEYDRNGIRISKTVNGAKTEYVWSDGKLIEERLPDGSLLGFQYDATGTAIGFDYFDYATNTFNFHYYLRNLQGDIVAIADRAGNIVVEYKYDAWGNLLSIAGEKADTLGTLNPFRYRGYYYDAETGFYYSKLKFIVRGNKVYVRYNISY